MGGYFEGGGVTRGEARPLVQYVYNVGLSLSQTISAILGGDPDESICSRTARARIAGNRFCQFILEPFLNAIMGSQDHCQNSLELDEDFKKEIWRWK
jgi:hypothetical protein